MASGGLDQPRGITIGPDGSLYVSSFFGNSVLRYDGTTGAFIDAFVAPGSGGLVVAAGIAFSGGQLYVSSTQTNQVLRYNGTTGAFVDA